MRTKRFLKVLFLLSTLSLALPWFTYNPGVMGYCRGIAFAKWLVLPLLVTGVHLFLLPRSRTAALLAELGVMSQLAVYVIAFGRWQEVCNIAGGFRWADGLRTAQPGYWIATGLCLGMFVLYQVYFTNLWGHDSVQER